jgi:hypothetical protein
MSFIIFAYYSNKQMNFYPVIIILGYYYFMAAGIYDGRARSLEIVSEAPQLQAK